MVFSDFFKKYLKEYEDCRRIADFSVELNKIYLNGEYIYEFEGVFL